MYHPEVRIREVLRPMSGGAQSVLVSSDEGLFVVKHIANVQGKNLLANELLGSELLRAVGIPVPDWALAYYSEHTKTDASASHVLLDPQTRSCPQFASRFVLPHPGSLSYEILPRSLLHRLGNHLELAGIPIFDTLACSTDLRQAIYVEDPTDGLYYATFIDHGHLFGGPNWTNDTAGRRHFRSELVSSCTLSPDVITFWMDRFRATIPDAMVRAIRLIPSCWFSGDISQIEDRTLWRLERLHELVLCRLLENPTLADESYSSEKVFRTGIEAVNIGRYV